MPLRLLHGLRLFPCGVTHTPHKPDSPYIMRFLRMENFTMAMALMELSGTSIGS